MIELNEHCRVNKIIAKKMFYEQLDATQSIKNEFINKVERITWAYKLAEDTFGTAKTENVEEIQIFTLELKEKVLTKNLLNLITKKIPYKILFEVIYKDEKSNTKDFCYAIKVQDDFYWTQWNKKVDFNWTASNLEFLYQNIAKAIIQNGEEKTQHESEIAKDFKTLVATKQKRDELTKKIEQLTNKKRHEKQFNRKVALNLEIQKLEKELETTI